ncbi:hypothetical protein [Hymenobacter rubripertinctus]|uniref:DUF481 domain-containing protein n=1 Tax=Hymenobacter rubripertinctus TaxID=2029981 RepID=A0A418QH37_9BACT|nr:hypothetical protein [Hymenobacter rubripertinctus]RIY04564.1 hypothetical protein D0T11_21600 [Hymenobacter rubripertinctus]
MNPLACLLLAAALPLAAAAQTTPTDSVATFKHQLGLTASPVLDGFFKNNRALPLGLLYKRQTKPNQALRLGLIISQRYAHRFDTQLRVNPGFTNNLFGAELYIGREWQSPLNARWVAYTGFDSGLEYSRYNTRDEQARIGSFNGSDEELLFKREDLFTYYSAFLRPLIGVRYQLSPFLYASVEAVVSARFLRTNLRDRSSLTRISTNEILSSDGTKVKDNAFRASLQPISQLTLHYCFGVPVR